MKKDSSREPLGTSMTRESLPCLKKQKNQQFKLVGYQVYKEKSSDLKSFPKAHCVS